MRDNYTIIIKPLFTEKGTAMKEKENKLIVIVAIDANKIEIKKAFEGIFKVKVEKVATLHVRGKWKRYGRSQTRGMTSERKKAIITLKKGENIDFIEGF